MTSAWDVYDALIEDLPEDVTVTASHRGPRWTRVLNSADGVGSAWTMDLRSRPALSADVPDAGRPLRDVAALVKSWNLAEAGVGLAALNSWYSKAEVAAEQGFEETGAGLTWREVFEPYNDVVEGQKVAVILPRQQDRAAPHRARGRRRRPHRHGRPLHADAPLVAGPRRRHRHRLGRRHLRAPRPPRGAP